ncbi:MAG: hypothetical protein IPJ65_16350 [Archangiaceae bacterium]|nr:hypothetical protein [Archangiaceae bacterium]
MTDQRVLGLLALTLAAPPTYASSAVVGSFTQGNGASQQVAHPLGLQPRAAIFWASGGTSVGTIERSAYPMVGFTDGAATYVSGMTAVDNQSFNYGARAIAPALITFDTGTNTPLARATLAGWNASTFTLAWSPNDGLPRVIHYLLIGGTDVSAKALDFITNNTASTQAVTGVGFKPDLLVSLYAAFANSGLPSYSPSLHSHLSAAGPGVEWSLGLNVQTAGFANRYFAPDALFITQSTPPVFTANVASFDSNGFTLNLTRSSGNARIMTLCLAGQGLAVGLLTTSAPGTQQVGGLAFSPQTVLASTGFMPASETPATVARFSIGGASQTQTIATAMRSIVSPLPTSATSLYDATTLLAEAEATPGISARLARFSTDGFTLEWSGTDGGPISVGYLAFGVGDAGAADAGAADAGAADAGAADAGAADAGAADAGAGDAGAADAGAADAGAADAGAADAGAADAGPADAGAADAGAADAGAVDAGAVDAGPDDGGVRPAERQLHVGCGCTAAPAELGLALAAMLLVRFRRRSRGETFVAPVRR